MARFIAQDRDETGSQWSVDSAENPWREEQRKARERVDVLKALVNDRLYNRDVPFSRDVIWTAPAAEEVEKLSEDPYAASEGSDAGTLPRAAPKGPALAPEPAAPSPRPRPEDEEAFREAEAERKRELLAGMDGHLVWMRGSNPKSQLVLPSEADELKARRKAVAEARAGPQRTPVRLGSRPYESWFCIERAGPVTASHFQEELHDLCGVLCDSDANDILAASATFKQLLDDDQVDSQRVCWRADFVQEVKLTARGSGLRQAVVTEYFPVTDKLLAKGYVSAACSSGGREVWSPSFVNLLEALHVRWGLSHEGPPEERVRLAEAELLARRPMMTFPQRRAAPALGPKQAAMPEGLLRRLRGGEGALPAAAGPGPPEPPAVPQRLPHRICYETDEPWTTKFLYTPPLKKDAPSTGSPSEEAAAEPPPLTDSPSGGWLRKSSSLLGLGRRLSLTGKK